MPDPGRVSIVEEPSRKSMVGDPRREPTGPIAERDAKSARKVQQKVAAKEPPRTREVADPQRSAVRNEARPPAAFEGRSARIPYDPRARQPAANSGTLRGPAAAPSGTPRQARVPDDPRLGVSRTLRNSDDPRRGSPPPARGQAPAQREVEELDYEFEAPRPAHNSDNPRASTGAARESESARREPARPAAARGNESRRYPSQPGATAASGPLEVYCEIDGAAVTFEPGDLSAAGLFVPTPRPPQVDSEVHVFLRIGDARFEASGHVVQSLSCEAAKKERRRPGFGLLFTNLEDDARCRLRDAIDALLAERTERLQGLAADNERPESKPSPAPAVDPQEYELLERLRGELAALQSQPPWTVLGISQGAEPACAREAFFAASKRYHPHIYARYVLPEIKDVVTQLFIAYKRAFTSMTKTGRSPRNATAGRAATSGNSPGRSSDPGNK